MVAKILFIEQILYKKGRGSTAAPPGALSLAFHFIFFFFKGLFLFLKNFYLFMIVTQNEREAETQAEGEAGSMHREPNVGLDPRSPGLRPGPKAGAKLLRHPGIPLMDF